MNANIKRSIDRYQNLLVQWSAPTLQHEYVPAPVRPPVRPSMFTDTIGEMIAMKGIAI